ncbi:MAG: COG1361 S-layer family protein [Candidatus Woesearchaeota archaeon]
MRKKITSNTRTGNTKMNSTGGIAGGTARMMMGIAVALVILMGFAPSAMATYEESNTIATNSQTGTSNLQVMTLKYEPFPVNPGEYVDVWLKFGNEGDADINDLTIELQPEYPFSIDDSEEKQRHFGKVLANSMVLVHYKVRVDPDAVEGDAYLKYRYRYEDSDLAWEEAMEKIRIQTREAVLSIDSVDSDPGTIKPGEEANVQLRLKNLASSVMRDISVKLDLSMSTVAKNPSKTTPTSAVIDSYYNALPFAPIKSSTEKRISHLKEGEETTIDYRIKAFPDAESKVYKVPVRITYKDELDRNYTKDDIIGLVVGADPDLDIKAEENTIYGERMTGEVTVKLVNKGVTDLRFMNIELQDSADYSIISPSEVYIGDVDSDDYESADFKLYVDEIGKDDILKLPLHLEYKDANNNEYEQDEIVEVKAYSQAKRGEGGTSKAFIIIAIVVIMLAAWYGYRRWEKKKKKR